MKQQIIKAIEAYQVIYIYRHERPDPDAIGSQAGLAALIKANYPEKQVVLMGEDDESMHFLARMNKDTDEKPSGDALVIVCDTANTERIDGEGSEDGGKRIKIDHHPEVESYGDISWVQTESSSTCEMLVGLALEGESVFKWQIPADAARLLYAGIVGDTGRFQFSNTTPETLRCAAEMLEYDFDAAELITRFYKSEEKLVRFRGEVLTNFTLTGNGLGYMYITNDMLERYRLTVNESSAVINSFSDTEGLKAWVFFVEDTENQNYRVRLRSKGPVINEVAQNHNGGGHPMASGAKAKDKKETEDILEELDMLCKSYKETPDK
ncbi:phosphoesterase RecJ domain-containing protein [Alteribacillus persepolensis]|uniref:Phosphoesterase RecJ domain-containing protein n=2 Tax=Alteribacillus persepolensis TaxID=568899 RepID=A0A1G8BHL9_9BACI|nr:phosphoesterase RecJ domain-containing protein [Alteribacillus persepolensis]